ncbi:conserved hypothetical protein [Vibrio nigripulchritudo FTn2]|uniref:hypothetical protein n=1 Tax=Vibrio nigripulchritudo TaxID=28173 RepID=UPI0003B1B0EE|nr:hypothetical protein [Vibrio nigripulchritudo]BCL74158.1 hypothetical protein VNTUMSATTG_60950 [Vibrio nigripulchritudo]CCN41404.1 conserved hypothetical protein [Vibrio nigripulchritudo FTn2]
MSKLKNSGAKSALSKPNKKEAGGAITVTSKQAQTTYNVPPISLRLSSRDKSNVNSWVKDLKNLTERGVSPAKLMRALTGYRNDLDDSDRDSFDRALVGYIEKMN